MTQEITQAIYGRVSTSDQDGSSQIHRLRQWAASEGRPVVMERTDNATGRNLDRPGLEEIMREARAHRIRAVAITKVDRWCRSLIDLSTTVHELHALKVEVRFIDQGLVVSPERTDGTGRLTLNLLGAVAEWESSIISERTRESLQYLRSRGVRLGRPPTHVLTSDHVGRAVELHRGGMGWGRLPGALGLPPGARTALRDRVLAAIRNGGEIRPSEEELL